MVDIGALKTKYFVEAGDAHLPSQPVPATFEGCKVTPLIDGVTYFQELANLFAKLGNGATPADNAGQFIYIANWWFDLFGDGVSVGAVTLGPTGVARSLEDILKEKAALGVDVRVLGWVSWAVSGNELALKYGGAAIKSIADLNATTLKSIAALRAAPNLDKSCCLNITGHTAGAAHTKLVVAGTTSSAVGFTGGIDFRMDRYSDEDHTSGIWHDVVTKVEGPAVQALHDFYKQMWDEVIARSVKTFRIGTTNMPSFVPGTSNVPPKTFPPASFGAHYVQSLRTIPMFNYAITNRFPEGPPISFAPSGLFEVASAWQKAISAAEDYIYMEDQAFWSQTVMGWIKTRIQSTSNLKVILVTGTPDPNDPPFDDYNIIAFQSGLLDGLTSAQQARVRIFQRKGLVVHSKTTLIDDHWAIIGSANCIQRSLYTDIEHSIAMLDETDTLVRDYRVSLWGGHFKIPAAGRSVLNNIQQALNIWESSWGISGSGIVLPATFSVVTVPSTKVTLTPEQQEKYDRYTDPDSRTAWGGCTP